MASTTADLQTLSSQAGIALTKAGVPHQATNDLAWAWFHLGVGAQSASWYPYW